ncbi:MAG: glutamate--tRNA ligase [Betaproteobacteria bacterium]|nr:glutamate--tRNA ligase [Betaproteobacteria bacterium]MDH5351082.1 glutamate--tRNA ligase [Betaproteobacteria bacterium]
MTVRTRFAPSPTGFLHIGGARTALFSRAYARRHGGKFVLRIEDTDLERSTKESVQAILDGMTWLGLDWDEGPFFQMERLPRYREVAEQLIAAGHAYRDYMPREALDALRAQQTARGEKPRYDRAIGQNYRGEGPAPVRFRTPQEGTVGWKDLVKGVIEFPNAELDDLVILRADGVPTYNFGVVVDDLDMAITHVIRGDDHVNNTPRQIHIFRALGGALPEFAHLPMILGADGERLSKRHGAVSVTQYRDEGFLPEALANYLARLGWSHGDDEIFSMRELEQWFDFAHASHSPARFDPDKLAWLNHEYLKRADDARLAGLAAPLLGREPAREVVALLKDRAPTVAALAEQARMFYTEPGAQSVPAEAKPALAALRKDLETLAWERKALGAAVSGAAKSHNLKMPQLAMPLRRVLTGREQTPSIDAVLELLGRETVLARLARALA